MAEDATPQPDAYSAMWESARNQLMARQEEIKKSWERDSAAMTEQLNSFYEKLRDTPIWKQASPITDANADSSRQAFATAMKERILADQPFYAACLSLWAANSTEKPTQ